MLLALLVQLLLGLVHLMLTLQLQLVQRVLVLVTQLGVSGHGIGLRLCQLLQLRLGCRATVAGRCLITAH